MHRFSLIAYLSETSSREIRNIQDEIFKFSGSRAFLDCWDPHITIGDGFQVGAKEIAKFYKDIYLVSKNARPFRLLLKGFDFIEEPARSDPSKTAYLIHLKALYANDLELLIEELRKNLSTKYKKWFRQRIPYLHHITLAAGDLNEKGYEKTKKHLKKRGFSREIIIDNIALSEFNEVEKKWKCCKKFYLRYSKK